MPRIVTAEDLRARLGRELDALRESEEALYVSKRGRLAGVLLDPDRYADLLERLEYLEDSLVRLAVGSFWGIALGIPLGILVGLSQRAHKALWPVLLFFQAIGDIAWLPILLIWFGFGLTTMTERVKSLGGSCVIESVLNKGTTIRIEIPVQREKTERARALELVGGIS